MSMDVQSVGKAAAAATIASVEDITLVPAAGLAGETASGWSVATVTNTTADVVAAPASSWATALNAHEPAVAVDQLTLSGSPWQSR